MAGVNFINPFGLASAPPCTTAAMIRRSFEAGWSFAVTKTFGLDEDLVTNVSPRIVRGTYNAHYGPHQTGFINIELITEKTAAYWLKAIHELKRDFPDRVIVASVMCGYNEEQWKKLTDLCCRVGSDIVELNLSCPHGMGEAGMGLACGQDPDMVRNIVKWCKEAAAATKTPVFAKLTNNITEIAVIARAVKEANGDGVTAINTLHGILDLDPNGEAWPKIGKEKFATSGGVCGDVNRPSTTRAIWSINQFAPGLEIMATGGISSAASTLQMLHVGAQTVQICSAVQNQDFSVIDDYVTGLKTHLYMKGRGELDGVTYQNNWKSRTSWAGTADNTNPPALRKPEEEGSLTTTSRLPKLGPFARQRAADRKKFWEQNDPKKVRGEGGVVVPDIEALPLPKRVPTLGEQVGLTHRKYVRSHNDLSRDDQVVAVINDDMCINCGKCYLTCNDSGYQAIKFNGDNHIPEVDADRCTGCGLCQAVCPAPGTIEYMPMGRRFEPKRGLEVKKDRWRDGGEALVKAKVTVNPN
jgi:dihydropyrimidine dehydrogenase (NADP+)